MKSNRLIPSVGDVGVLLDRNYREGENKKISPLLVFIRFLNITNL